MKVLSTAGFISTATAVKELLNLLTIVISKPPYLLMDFPSLIYIINAILALLILNIRLSFSY